MAAEASVPARAEEVVHESEEPETERGEQDEAADSVRPGSSPSPAAPAIARPASMTSTVSTMRIPPAVGSGRPR